MADETDEKMLINTTYLKWSGEFSLLPTVALLVYLFMIIAGVLPWWTLLLILAYRLDFITIDAKRFLYKNKDI
jgi:hypothetical protein